eukprot:719352-Alexandrium_andersonii.AAC.1
MLRRRRPAARRSRPARRWATRAPRRRRCRSRSATIQYIKLACVPLPRPLCTPQERCRGAPTAAFPGFRIMQFPALSKRTLPWCSYRSPRLCRAFLQFPALAT